MSTLDKVLILVYVVGFPITFRLIARQTYYEGWDKQSKLHRFWHSLGTGVVFGLIWPIIAVILCIGGTVAGVGWLGKQGRNSKLHAGSALIFFGRPPEEKAVGEIEPEDGNGFPLLPDGPGKQEDSC